jgi:hypothetical protein
MTSSTGSLPAETTLLMGRLSTVGPAINCGVEVLVVLVADKMERAPVEDFLEPIELSMAASSSLESCLRRTHDGTRDEGDFDRIRLAMEGDFGRSIFEEGLNAVIMAGAMERVSWRECLFCLP